MRHIAHLLKSMAKVHIFFHICKFFVKNLSAVNIFYADSDSYLFAP